MRKKDCIYLSDTLKSVIKLADIKRVNLENTTIEITSKNLTKSYIDYTNEDKARFEYSYLLKALKKFNGSEIYV